MRSAIYYTLIVLILSVYGGQVCPFIASLHFAGWLTTLALVFGAALAARGPVIRAATAGLAPFQWTARQFTADMALFMAAGLAISLIDALVHDFPFASAFKVMMGCVTLGFFASVDLALESEREVFRHYAASGEEPPARERVFPLTTKLALFATFTVISVSGVFALVLTRDFDLLSELGAEGAGRYMREVLVELMFIGAVALIAVVNLILSFSRNLKLVIASENGTLSAVTNGDLSARAVSAANDEFGQMARYTNTMIRQLAARAEEVEKTQDVTIMTLASLAETRDNETGAHILRTQRYVRALAEHLKTHPAFSGFLNGRTVDLLYKSAPLHDIGKVGVPDRILLKPGKLTPEEFEEMKKHPVYGYQSLRLAADILGGSSFLTYAEEIAYTHHEKWNGSGYPRGLAGAAIPLSGRLMALADVYDALISKRVYKDAFSHEKAREIILEGRGSHFDPDVVDAFLAIEEEFVRIAAGHKDGAALSLA